MKRYLFLVISLLSFASLKAQTYTSGHITATVTDTMYHDSTQCQTYRILTYNMNIDTSYTGEIVYIVDSSTGSLIDSAINTTGASPWIFPATISQIGQWDLNLSPGGYQVFYGPVTKITAGADTLAYIESIDSFYVTNPCTYGSVKGSVYIDNNANCIFDVGDIGIFSPDVTITANLSSPPGAGWTGGFGPGFSDSAWVTSYFFSVQQSWMVNYSVFLPPYYAFIFPTSPCFTTSYSFTTLPQIGVDFPLQCTSNVDVQCYALSPASVRLHRPFYMQPYVSNTGCDSVSGILTLVLDSRVYYDSALSTNPANIVHGDTLIWNYSGLSSISGGAYWNSFFSNIYLTPDSTTLAVGDTLCFRVYTNIPPTDVNPLNNDYSFCLPVVYSYDPNSKEVSPAGTGPQGYLPAGTDTLTYSLHFQNTGNDMAYNISIIDTLDSHINASSLKILGTSFNMIPAWLTPHVVQFNFNNIDLPDSFNNEAGSQGEVRFRVALYHGLPAGTQIKNIGYIYFDSNPPVVTNTTLSTIAVSDKIDQIYLKSEVTVYPNPATTSLTINSAKNITSIAISNLVGQTICTNEYNATQVQVDVSALSPGVYFVKINGTEVQKFVKE